MRARTIAKSYIFHIQLNGVTVKTINESNKGEMMKRVWKTFNSYAKGKKFIEAIESSKYLGSLAWGKGDDVMSLIEG